MKSSKTTRIESVDGYSDYKETHPSYGMMVINRATNSKGVPLFGSSLQHRELITIRISTGERIRNLHQDWNHPDELVVEIEMSPVQFAEVITSFGQGGGVPCTLKGYRDTDGKWLRPDYPDYTNFKNEIRDEFEESTKKVAKNLDGVIQDLQVMLSHKSITKSEVNNILMYLTKVRQDIASNMPFVVDQFHEQMESTVGEAKSEIEAFYLRRVTELGLNALRKSDTSSPIELPEAK